MYLDKLYNKLFSENNLKGIEVLNREIRLFAEADPATRLRQLLDTIRIKQSKGMDVTNEQAQVKQLQAQMNNGATNPTSNFDVSKGMKNAMDLLGKVRIAKLNFDFLTNSLGNIGGFFMGK